MSRRRKNRGLRAPLVSYVGGSAISQLAPSKSKPRTGHGWSEQKTELDPLRHANHSARVIDAVRQDTRVLLATLDAFGMGASTRVVAVVERPLVRATLAALERGSEFTDEDARVNLSRLVGTLARNDGHLVTVAPIATFPLLLEVLAGAITRQLAHGCVSALGLEELADEIAAPRVIATRFGLSVESLDPIEGRPL